MEWIRLGKKKVGRRILQESRKIRRKRERRKLCRHVWL